MLLESWPLAVFRLLFGLIGLRLCWRAFKNPEWVQGADLAPIAFLFAALPVLTGAVMLVLWIYGAKFPHPRCNRPFGQISRLT